MNVYENSPRNAPERRQRQRPLVSPNPKAPLREQLHEVMRFFHYSERTEETYWQWIERFLRFHRRPGPAAPATSVHPSATPALTRTGSAGAEGNPTPYVVAYSRNPEATEGEQRGWRHPRAMGAEEVGSFLTHLASVSPHY